MTPPQSTGFADPTDQDVAALVAEALNFGRELAHKGWSSGQFTTAQLDLMDEALDRLPALAAERNLLANHIAEIEKEHEATFDRAEASEARATAREAQLAKAREALKPFADLGVGSGPDDEHDDQPYRILRGAIRRARSVLEG